MREKVKKNNFPLKIKKKIPHKKLYNLFGK